MERKESMTSKGSTASKDTGIDLDSLSEEDLALSAEELKRKLATMRRMLAAQEARRHIERSRPSPSTRKASIIDGTFLSAVFGGVFIMIVAVSFHAFSNLYRAIVKKFTHVHTEL